MSETRLYFIRNETTGNVKIGISKDPEARLRSLQTGSDATLTIMDTFPGNKWCEASLHDEFKALHVRGEWFRFGPELQEFFERCRAERAQWRPVEEYPEITQYVPQYNRIVRAAVDKAMDHCCRGWREKLKPQPKPRLEWPGLDLS